MQNVVLFGSVLTNLKEKDELSPGKQQKGGTLRGDFLTFLSHSLNSMNRNNVSGNHLITVC